MTVKKIFALSFAGLLSTLSFANVETLKSNLEQKHPTIKVTNIQPTEIKNLYSAQYNNQVVYLDQAAEHFLIGSMLRLKDQKNLTKDLVIAQNSIDFNTLPLQDALKTVRGNGKRQLAIFSDPNCPYCKVLEGNLSELKDVTIYTFMYPIKQQSIVPTQQVWCSANKEFAWQNLIQKAIQPTASATCNNPIERNIALGKKLGIQGTPAIIFANGFKVTGAHPAKDIENIWKELGL